MIRGGGKDPMGVTSEGLDVVEQFGLRLRE